MDPLTLSILTYLVIALGVWAGIVMAILGRIVYCAKTRRGVARTSDVVLFFVTMIATVAAFVVVFIWPGLIHLIPSAVAFASIGSIPVLGYLTELGVKHWIRLKNSFRSQVDESASH